MIPQEALRNLNIVNHYSNKTVDYLKVTDGAIFKIKELLTNRGKPSSGIKINLKTKGCSGLSYKIEYADYEVNVSKFDDLVTKDGINIFIDPKMSLFIIGTTLDYKEEVLKSGFVFINPNEKGRCGCGESFYV